MTAEDLVLMALDNGYPDNNTDPYGGSIDGPLTDEVDNVFNDVPVQAPGGSTGVFHSAAAYEIDFEATGTLENPQVYNRAGSILNTNAGQVTVFSTHPDDDGEVRVNGKVGGNWAPENVAVAGVLESVGSTTFDAASVWFSEYLREGAAAKPIGDVSVRIGGEVFAVIRGTGKPAASDVGNGEYMATALFEIAPCTAKNTELTFGANNRTQAPTNIGSWAAGTFDAKIDLPADLEAEDEMHIAFRMTVPAGLPDPVLGPGKWVLDPGIEGTAVEPSEGS